MASSYDGSVLTARPAVESLARIPFFAGLDQAALERVAAGTRTRRFRRGEIIFHAGDPGMRCTSSCPAREDLAASEEGDEAILATLGPGDSSASWPCSTERHVPRRRPPFSRPRR